ncbi:MAG TPA: isoprenylcysteine carboxylmethyltransferase family protein [Sphingomicrobium sp.]|nr:isoprenylcysteine carboxylmethyltransferase family protein [Sphingomicrobium sp.]
MSRVASLMFALVAYAIFFATFLYLIVFVGNLDLGAYSPRTVDRPPSGLPVAAAVVVNLGLIALFGLQHSVMARQGFKRSWTRIVPPQAERSAYVLAASAALIVMVLFWQPIDTVIWSFADGAVATVLTALFWVGWLVVLISTFLINHFELFGLQQAWLHMRGREPTPHQLREPLFYKWVRHPIYAGFFLAFWATPHMTAGHLLLAAGLGVYMLIAIRYEEHDLVDYYGEKYESYRSRVGMLTPRFRRRTSG